jgi:hypothetical protein
MGRTMATCMADDMAKDLSIGQLLKLSKLGKFREKSMGDMSMREFLKAHARAARPGYSPH